MEIKANLNYLRIAPRKVRLVAGLIRGMDTKEAEIQLKFMPKKAAVHLLKLLNSAIANAKNNFNLEKDALYIKKLTVNEGPPFKRQRAEAHGRAVPIMKRTSHINLVLDVKPGVKIEKRKTTKAEPEAVEEIEKVEEKEEKKPEIKPRRAPKEIKKGKEGRGLFKKVFRRKSF